MASLAESQMYSLVGPGCSSAAQARMWGSSLAKERQREVYWGLLEETFLPVREGHVGERLAFPFVPWKVVT